VNNPLKRNDVFRCHQEAHQRFGGAVSAYHVLREKKCWPAGCIYFLWHCVRLEKGNRCPHKFTVPGKKCSGCTHYVEEKLHFQPELLLDTEACNRFYEDLEAFDAWFEKASSVRQAVAGRIATIKPWFEKTVFSDGSHLRLRGYLLVLKKGFIGMEALDDVFYVRVPRTLMQQIRFVPKMKLEMTGEIREDRGRIVVHHPKAVEVLNRGWGWPWTDDRALVSVKTATLMMDQPDHCLACPWGALADVVDRSEPDEIKYRNLFCLKGIADSDACYVPAMKKLHGENRSPSTHPK
jgi:hypothetical protein